MASSSVSPPFVVEVTNRARPKFKKHPYKLMEDDLNGSFSSILYGMLHVEDIREYIHCNIEDLANVVILTLYTKHMMDGMGNLNPNFKSLQGKGFNQFMNFPIFK